MTFGPVWRRLSCPFLEKAQETEGNPMTTRSRQDKIIVGVDGSDASDRGPAPSPPSRVGAGNQRRGLDLLGFPGGA